jgi:hypothetical protein
MQDNKIYTKKQYIKKLKNEIFHHDDYYIGLTVDNLMLLDKPFQSATPEETNNDMAYNRQSLKLKHTYIYTISFLKKDINISKLANYLGYDIKEIKCIVFKKNNVIISFIREGSYESFLLAIQKDILKIKLIDYLYGS